MLQVLPRMLEAERAGVGVEGGPGQLCLQDRKEERGDPGRMGRLWRRIAIVPTNLSAR
jgi:hypothetical protein